MKMKIFYLSLLGVFVLAIVFFVSNTYDTFFGSDVHIQHQENIDIKEGIVIDFSSIIWGMDLDKHISVFPETDISLDLINQKSLVITPKQKWILDTEYEVRIDGVKNLVLADSRGVLTFSTRKYPKVNGFYPENDSRDVIIDIEDPIRIDFNKSLEDFNVKLDMQPESKMAYSIDKNKKELRFVFKEGYQKGEKYNLTVLVKHKKESEYKRVYESSFETEFIPVDEWSDDFAARIEQAKRFTIAKMKTGKYIDINLKKQILSIFDNGNIIDSFLISSGKRGMDTPKGEFNIANKYPRPWSKKYSLFMPYWMAIVPSGKFGIHELPEWPGGYKEGQNHLGIPVSHGCIRLGVGAAERVYNWADIGTPVIVY